MWPYRRTNMKKSFLSVFVLFFILVIVSLAHAEFLTQLSQRQKECEKILKQSLEHATSLDPKQKECIKLLIDAKIPPETKPDTRLTPASKSV